VQIRVLWAGDKNVTSAVLPWFHRETLPCRKALQSLVSGNDTDVASAAMKKSPKKLFNAGRW
jgi:hypothetical protein